MGHACDAGCFRGARRCYPRTGTGEPAGATFGLLASDWSCFGGGEKEGIYIREAGCLDLGYSWLEEGLSSLPKPQPEGQSPLVTLQLGVQMDSFLLTRGRDCRRALWPGPVCSVPKVLGAESSGLSGYRHSPSARERQDSQDLCSLLPGTGD